MLEEVNGQQLKYRCADIRASFAVYFYTPLCGTCKVAEKMLQVVEATLPDLPLYKSNINFMSELAFEWEIKSVPCLIFVEHGKVARKLYAMRSVSDLYEALKPLLNKEAGKEQKE